MLSQDFCQIQLMLKWNNIVIFFVFVAKRNKEQYQNMEFYFRFSKKIIKISTYESDWSFILYVFP